MKANELRIGNLYNQFGNIHQVNGHIISELEKAPQGQLWCKPITLTDKWLLKFGFEKYFVNWYRVNNFYIRKIGDEFETEIGECLYKTIDYVHELQNLYFALTKKELTMK